MNKTPDKSDMASRISFNPYSVNINGVKKYRVYIPSIGKRNKSGQLKGTQKTFKTLKEAKEFGDTYRLVAKNSSVDLSKTDPRESIAFQSLEYQVQKLGFSDLVTFTEEMIKCDAIAKKYEFEGVSDAMEYIKRNQHYSSSVLTVGKILTLFKLKQNNWSSNDLSSYNSCTKYLRFKIETITPQIEPPDPKKYPEGYKYISREIYEAHTQSLVCD